MLGEEPGGGSFDRREKQVETQVLGKKQGLLGRGLRQGWDSVWRFQGLRDSENL